MKVSEVMTRRVVTVDSDASVLQAARLMLENGISGLPVVDGHRQLVRIVTEGDFLRRVETDTVPHRSRWIEFLIGPGRLADEYVHSRGRKVGEVMSPTPHTVAEDTLLEDAVHLMEQKRVRRLPVVRGTRLVGIISRADLLHALVSIARKMPKSTKKDTEIRARVLDELEKQPWRPIGLNIIVRHGEVELFGVIVDERHRAAAKVAVENIPGVKAIHDHLIWIQPESERVVFPPEDEAVQARRR